MVHQSLDQEESRKPTRSVHPMLPRPLFKQFASTIVVTGVGRLGPRASIWPTAPSPRSWPAVHRTWPRPCPRRASDRGARARRPSESQVGARLTPTFWIRCSTIIAQLRVCEGGRKRDLWRLPWRSARVHGRKQEGSSESNLWLVPVRQVTFWNNTWP